MLTNSQYTEAKKFINTTLNSADSFISYEINRILNSKSDWAETFSNMPLSAQLRAIYRNRSEDYTGINAQGQQFTSRAWSHAKLQLLIAVGKCAVATEAVEEAEELEAQLDEAPSFLSELSFD